jgi:hypothetical protein
MSDKFILKLSNNNNKYDELASIILKSVLNKVIKEKIRCSIVFDF